MRNSEPLMERAVGRWRSLLPQFGVSERFLINRAGPCPICGGKDRFRYDDNGGRGTYFCNQCGPGSGVDLVMKLNGWDFKTAATAVEKALPSAAVVIRRGAERRGSSDVAMKSWRLAHPIIDGDPVSLYLASRGLPGTSSPSLRYRPNAPYKHEDGRLTQLPAMVSLYQSPDKSAVTVQHLFLGPDGRKADLSPARKMAPCPIPSGGAVRLMPPAKTMGIAEGIETALSAAKLFELPVWAALDAGHLARWQPPNGVEAVIVFADHDDNFTGQAAAYELAKRLHVVAKIRVEVRLPGGVGDDWNDELLGSDREVDR